jgi:hypothetical protein
MFGPASFQLRYECLAGVIVWPENVAVLEGLTGDAAVYLTAGLLLFIKK